MALKNLPQLTKEDAVLDFTEGRTSSLRELCDWDLQELTRRLQVLGGQKAYNASGKRTNDPRRKKAVGKILHYCHELGWTKAAAHPQYAKLSPFATDARAAVKRVADVARFDEWAIKYSYLHKTLNEYTYEELPKLVSQVEAVVRNRVRC